MQFVLEALTLLWEPACDKGSHRVICHPAEAVSFALTTAVTCWYSIYPPVKDERLSRPEPTQINVLLGVAKTGVVIFIVCLVPGVSRSCAE